MLAFNQAVNLPVFFKIGRNIITKIPKILLSSKLDTGRILVLSGRQFSKQIATAICSSLPPSVSVLRYEVGCASEAIVEELQKVCIERKVELILSIGGGTVVDVGKRVHRLLGIPNIAIPTIISNDGLVSPIAVLETNQGMRNSFPGAVPVGVIVDLDIIRRSPRRYLVAAAGDVLSNVSASQDWMRLFIASNDTIEFNDLAYELALGAAESLVFFKNIDFDDDMFLTNVVRSQVYSGLAMSLAGSSRPCSGAEHLLSHAIDHLRVGDGELHGIQVGSISLFILSLLSTKIDIYLDFARRLGIPLDWRRLSSGVERNVEKIIAMARQVRPDRRTILDEFSDSDLCARSAEFGRQLGGLG